MRTKLYLGEMVSGVFLGALGGLVVGFLLGSGILDLIPSRHRVSHRSRYWTDMTFDQYKSNILWYPLYGALAGVVFGALYGFISAQEAEAKMKERAAEDAAKDLAGHER